MGAGNHGEHCLPELVHRRIEVGSQLLGARRKLRRDLIEQVAVRQPVETQRQGPDRRLGLPGLLGLLRLARCLLLLCKLALLGRLVLEASLLDRRVLERLHGAGHGADFIAARGIGYRGLEVTRGKAPMVEVSWVRGCVTLRASR